MGNTNFTLSDPPIHTPSKPEQLQDHYQIANVPKTKCFSQKHMKEQKMSGSCEGYCRNMEKYVLRQIDYKLMGQADILEQRQYLKQQAVFLNKQLTQLLSLKTNLLTHGIINVNTSRKAKHQTNQWNYAIAEQKVKNNRQLLNLLKKEYESLELKLKKYSQPFQKLKIDEQIDKVKKNQAHLRANLSQRKKKNIFNEKKLALKNQYESSTNKLYFDLQEDFLVASKKKQDLIEKIKEIESKNGNKTQGMQSIEGHYVNLQIQTNDQESLFCKEKQNQKNRDTYNLLCRKIELATKKKYRQIEHHKNRYESLVEEKQSITKRIEVLDRKIENSVYFKPKFAQKKQSQQMTNENRFNSSTQKVIQKHLRQQNSSKEQFVFVLTGLDESERQILRVAQKKHRAYRYKSETSTDMASNRYSSEYLLKIPMRQKQTREKHCQSTRQQCNRLSNLILRKQKKFSNISCYQL